MSDGDKPLPGRDYAAAYAIARDLADCAEPVESFAEQVTDPSEPFYSCFLCQASTESEESGPGMLAHMGWCPWARAQILFGEDANLSSAAVELITGMLAVDVILRMAPVSRDHSSGPPEYA